jgi:ELWxxDGT repeat protein
MCVHSQKELRMKQNLPSLIFSCFYTLKRFALTIAVTSCLQQPSFSQAQLLKDINEEPAQSDNINRWITDAGSRMYFLHDGELWKSNGSPTTTEMIRKFASISNLTIVGGTLYFTALRSANEGAELWKSNGFASGTVMVKDINPGPNGSNPEQLINVNGKLFFVANNKTNGKELWVSDGTSSGTYLVKDILRVSGSSNPSGLSNLNGTLYFSANDGVTGYELWKSDGTSAGTMMVKDIRPGAKVSSSPTNLVSINNKLYFAANDGARGSELWTSDGTATGTVLIKDIFVGTAGSGIENFVDVNGKIFFTANDGVHGDELWKTDGTTVGTAMVKDLNPGRNGSNTTDPFLAPMHSFTNINGILYFIASRDVKDYIYRSDGTAPGTFIIQQAVGVGINEPNPAFTYFDGSVYFFNRASLNDYDQYALWKMPYNGALPQAIKAFAENASYYDQYEQEMISYKGFLYTTGRFFVPNTSTFGPFRFIRSNGTSVGTIYIKELPSPTNGSNPDEMIRVNDLVYIRTKPDHGWPQTPFELYRTDGTPAGTIKVMDLFENTEMKKVGNKLFINTYDDYGAKLVATSGTPETTITVRSTQSSSNPVQNLTDLNGTLYFSDRYGILWKSDGTVAGTKMVSDFMGIESLIAANGVVYIFGNSYDSGLELWKTGLNEWEVSLVKRLRTTDDQLPRFNPSATIANITYFVSSDGVHGNEIWRTDGTADGTFMMFDVNTNDSGYNFFDDIRSFIVFNNKLYFSAKSSQGVWGFYMITGDHSYQSIGELPPVNQFTIVDDTMFLFAKVDAYDYNYQHQIYTSDGTPGTMSLLHTLEGFGGIFDYAVIDKHVYFASNGSYDIMRTDGRSCSPMSITSGTQGAYPMESIRNNLIFGSSTGSTGKEPYVYANISDIPDRSGCGPNVQSASLMVDDEAIITPYPNPFVSGFSLRINGKDDEVADVAVFTSFGRPVEIMRGLKANTDYSGLGQGWIKGIYLVKVSKNGEMKNYTVVKE